MTVEEIAAGIKNKPMLLLALTDIQSYDRSGYVWNWRQKSREKLQAAGLVTPLVDEFRHGHKMSVCRLTDLGRSVAAALKETGNG